ncbi:MAG TPA: septation protein SepH [Pseudolysinimonas sp.]|nr:septation protein SepH [Pseudolysinimonas sp.]
MQELKVIGVEDGALLVASDEGARYRVAVDQVLQSRLRQSSPDLGTGRKLSPREIQTHIRAGMSAEDVSTVTGASLEYVQRFEGPVLAEREFVIESALNVPVHTALEMDPLAGGATFGSVIRRRLVDAGAIGERWASWKEEGGDWIVKLTFVAEQVDHDARWTFEPKKSALSPQNSEAVALSQQGDLPGSLIPRLRAVATDDSAGSSRFDSGAFDISGAEPAEADGHMDLVGDAVVADPASAEPSPFAPPPVASTGVDTGPLLEAVPHGRIGTANAANADTAPRAMNQTADLLEALRRRRGERDPMDPAPEEPIASHPSTGAVRLIDIPFDETGAMPRVPSSTGSTGTGPNGISRGSKKNRASLPSWDEIVFGARSDEDL